MSLKQMNFNTEQNFSGKILSELPPQKNYSIGSVLEKGFILNSEKELPENELLNFYNQNKSSFNYFAHIDEGFGDWGISSSGKIVSRHDLLPIYYCEGRIFLIKGDFSKSRDQLKDLISSKMV